MPIKEGDIHIKRGYSEFGEDIKFGVKVINNTAYMLGDVEVILDYPSKVLQLLEPASKVRTIGNIKPDSALTANYLLKPLDCVEDEINATIVYKDHKGIKQTLDMRPKHIDFVCPFINQKPITESEYYALIEKSLFVEEGFNFTGIGVSDLIQIINQTCVNMLHKVASKEFTNPNRKVLYLSGESKVRKAYSLLTVVIQENPDGLSLLLRAYSDQKETLSGFLKDVANRIRNLVKTIDSAKEIGVIQHQQVINIIDSVVQRTTFAGVSGTGKTEVKIQDSIVQRSGDLTKETNYCTECGKTIQKDFALCPYCGTKVQR